jgi:sterol desaturase/sphingolipid hydroxylase (fatty acid hydroxylase superfamily)
MILLAEFSVILAVVLFLGYLAPAGAYYWLYHIRGKQQHLEPIQTRRPTAKDIRREVHLSLITCLIFAIMATAVYQLYKSGHTSIYWRLRDYPYGYLFVSVFVALVVHDTWFYWTHRFMHWRPVFKYMHLDHHRSVSPTPWAIYAFNPAEAVVQFLIICLIIVFLPMHPLGLLLFFWVDAQVNTAGHTGYEIVPRFLSHSPWFQGLNTVTHHDLHHTHPNKNFGSFFNVWDRWMGTYLPDEAAEKSHEPSMVPTELAEQDDPERRSANGPHRRPLSLPTELPWRRKSVM